MSKKIADYFITGFIDIYGMAQLVRRHFIFFPILSVFILLCLSFILYVDLCVFNVYKVICALF